MRPKGAFYGFLQIEGLTDSLGFARDLVRKARALSRRPRGSDTLRREARLAYAILAPTLLVVLFVVVYPFFAALYLSVQDKMVGAISPACGLP